MTKEIPLTMGKVALVDDDVFDQQGIFKWHAKKGRKGTFYAGRWVGPRSAKQLLLLHREIMQAPPDKQVDHIDRNGLNCQRYNMRLATHQQNMCNRGAQVNNVSGYKGAHWIPDRNKWMSNISVNGRSIFLGHFADKLQSARAYDAAARFYFGEFAILNFPDEYHLFPYRV